MSCYSGLRRDIHLGILPYCIDDGDRLTYSEMVDYFNTMVSGVTVSGGVSYAEMVLYVDTHCTQSGISYSDMVDYVSSHCTYSGITNEQMQLYVSEYVTEHCTSSGVSYIEMLDYVNSAITTYSGEAYLQMTNYVDNAMTAYSGIIYQQMTDYVNEHCTTISGYITYPEMVDYVATHCTASGGASQEQLDSIYAAITTLSGKVTCWEDFFYNQDFELTFDYPTLSGNISGTRSFDGGIF